MYGFIYITTNHVNGRQYIGQKKYDKSGKWKKYLGSGMALKKAIAKYGLESFSKEIIEECDSKEMLDERERYWINYYNATKSDHFYNIAKGGDGGNVVAGYTEKEYNSYPTGFKTIEEWHKAVDKIIFSFEFIKNFKDLKYLRTSKEEFNKLKEKYEEGMELFKKYLGDLWD